jgi:hypothetical protein
MGDGTSASTTTPTALCDATNSIVTQPISGSFAVIIERMQFTFWQAANHFYAPLDMMKNIAQKMPYRQIEQRATSVVGQERFNFIAPYMHMGFSGEAAYNEANAVWIAARLSGQVAAGKPTALDVGGDTFVTPLIRIMAEMSDTPFHRDWSLGVAGNNMPRISRQVVSQFQGFMLSSHFLSGQQGFGDAEAAAPWNTNLILPLAVDALYADGVRLPVTSGTNMSVAKQCSSFQVRSIDESSIHIVLLVTMCHAGPFR